MELGTFPDKRIRDSFIHHPNQDVVGDAGAYLAVAVASRSDQGHGEGMLVCIGLGWDLYIFFPFRLSFAVLSKLSQSLGR